MPHSKRHRFYLRVRCIPGVGIQQILVGGTNVDFFKHPIISPTAPDANPAGPMAEIRSFDIGLNRQLIRSHPHLASSRQEGSVFLPVGLPLWSSAPFHQKIVRGSIKDERLPVEREAAKAI